MPLVDHWDNYEPYPTTSHVEGDKTFGEIEKDDTLYCLTEDNKMVEVKVKAPLHIYKHHWVITYSNKSINFGTEFCANVEAAQDNSIADFRRYDDYLIFGSRFAVVGTSRESVIKFRQRYYEDKIVKLEDKLKAYKGAVASLMSMSND